MASPSALDLGVGAAPVLSPLPLLYRLLRPLVRRLLERHFDLSVDGVERLPARGPFIIAANHHNYLDGLVLAAAVPPPISFLVMPRVWRATPLHPLFHRHIGSIRLDPSRGDIGAVRRALGALEQGHVVGIFPEGPFSVRGRLEAGLHGVAVLALRSGVRVVPTGIRGTFEALRGRRAYIPRRHRLGVRFGVPRRFTGAAGTRVARVEVTRHIMTDIAALLV